MMPIGWSIGFIGSPVGGGGGGSATGTASTTPVTIAFKHSEGSFATTTKYTFSSVDLGSASADRMIVIGVSVIKVGSGVEEPANINLNGTPMTKVVAANDTPGDSSGASLWRLGLASGTVGTFSLSFGVTIAAIEIGVWQVSTGNHVPTNTGTDTASDPASIGATVPSNGGGITCYAARATGLSSWTISGFTEDYDDEPQNGCIGGGGHFSASSTIQANAVGDTPNSIAMVYASWGT